VSGTNATVGPQTDAMNRCPSAGSGMPKRLRGSESMLSMRANSMPSPAMRGRKTAFRKASASRKRAAVGTSLSVARYAKMAPDPW
jgi:hypothetical protein